MLSSAINNKNSVDTSAKHGSYSVKVHSEKYSTWYIQYQFADAKIAWLTWWCSSRFLRFCTVHIVKSDIYFYLIILQALISVVKSTWLASKICWRRVTRRVNFLWIISIWFCQTNWLTLYPPVLYTHQCGNTFMT